jgi:hypothetical protein
VWESAAAELGDADFTRVVEIMERCAGVTVKGKASQFAPAPEKL